MVENLQNTMVSRDYFDNIIKSMMDTLIVVDKEAKIETMNRATCELLGYSEEELTGRPVRIIFAEEEEEEVRRVFQFFREPREPGALRPFDTIRNRELTYKTKDGRLIPMLFNASVLADKAGNVTGVVAGAKDITDLKLAEAEIRKEKTFSENIIATVPDSLLVIDKDLRIKSANRSFYEQFQTGPEEVIGAPLIHLLGDEEGRLSAELTGLFGREGWMLKDFELHYASEELGERVFNITARSIIFAEEELIVLQDITELKQAEAEREKLNAELKQAQKMEAVGQLAGGIAHDFNNILLPLMIHAEMALMELPSESPLQRHVKQIYQASERARDLVKQILTFARKHEAARAPIKVSLMVKEVAKFLRSTIPSTIDIQYDIQTDQDMVLGDPTELNQLIVNLSTNAAHAMEERGGSLVIRLGNETFDGRAVERFSDLEPGPYVVLRVEDTGEGIEPQVLDKIFEPYFTTKETGKGTGLGLAVVHGIVKSYGGDITVDSELGRGTCFTVYLPQVQGDEDETQSEKGSSQLPRGNERILFVDDEETVMGAVRPMLEALGYSVTAKRSSVKALAAFTEDPDAFDLIITDQTMPEMTGKELARELLAIRPELPIILCTGYSPQIDEKRAKAMGIRGFVMKPIVMKEMARTIREVLEI